MKLIYSKHALAILLFILLLTFPITSFNLLQGQSTPSKQSDIPLESIRNFTEIIKLIREQYVHEVDNKKLITDAINGMLKGLDPHTAYLAEEAKKQFNERISGSFGGLGIQVDMDKSGLVRVIAPIENTPAYKIGIQTNDLIHKIDKTEVKGLTLSQAVKLMRGKIGTKVKISILRKNKENLNTNLDFEITREKITSVSIRSKIYLDQFGYIRITNFNQNTFTEFVDGYKKIQKNSKNQKIKGLLLDLRGNPGGRLQTTINIANLFLDKGTIVSTRSRKQKENMEAKANKEILVDPNIPVVVLINEGSASASEILAAALRENNRAILLGKKSFGKGSVQTVINLSNKAEIKLTTALYYTPSGKTIQAIGITPDIEIDIVKYEKIDYKARSESDYDTHISNEKANNSKEKENNTNHLTTEIIEKSNINTEDNQLIEAIKILKALTIYP